MDIERVSGGGITLYPLMPEHAEEMYGLLQDPSLYQYIDSLAPESVEGLRQRYRRLQTRQSEDGNQWWFNWVIARNDQSGLIGFVQATVEDNMAELAWLLGRSYQGRGYARAAVRLMLQQLKDQGVAQFRCHIHPEHHASKQLAEKLGFRMSDELVGGEYRWYR